MSHQCNGSFYSGFHQAILGWEMSWKTFEFELFNSTLLWKYCWIGGRVRRNNKTDWIIKNRVWAFAWPTLNEERSQLEW